LIWPGKSRANPSGAHSTISSRMSENEAVAELLRYPAKPHGERTNPYLPLVFRAVQRYLGLWVFPSSRFDARSSYPSRSARIKSLFAV
jgi:hypothetical protein